MIITGEERKTIQQLMSPPREAVPFSALQGEFQLTPQALVQEARSRVVWKPLKGSQALALCAPADEILYSGTRGPGKTATQLMHFRQFVGLGYGQYLRGVIFDRKYPNLTDIISQSKRIFPLFGDGARFVGSGTLSWHWPTGEVLMFRHLHGPDDYWNYHGMELPWQGFNELTKYPTSECYDAMQSCLRTSFVPHLHSPGLSDKERELLQDTIEAEWPLEDMIGPMQARLLRMKLLPELPLRTFSTTNPYGAGHNWVKRRFVAPLKDTPKEQIEGRILRRTRVLFNPRTQRREEVTKSQVHLKGTWRENTFLPKNYPATLTDIKDPNKRKAWLKGDWDIVAGGALDDVWDPKVHVLPRFKLPKAWTDHNRSMDWGSTHPFWIGYWTKCNGEELEIESPDGKVRKFAPFPGSLILIQEWYGTHEIGTNEGLKMSARKVALGCKDRERELAVRGWATGKIKAGPADNQISNVNEEESKSIRHLMAMEGITWEPSDKSPGSRKNGLELLRQALENALDNSGPGIYFMDNCQGVIQTLPVLPRDEDDPDDVDTTSEDHPYDGVRYEVLKMLKDYVRASPIEM